LGKEYRSFSSSLCSFLHSPVTSFALRRYSRILREEIINNVTIRQQNGLVETIIKEIEQNQLTWYGQVQRMAEGRLPKIALN
jgi:hypothetical protein